MRLMSVTDENSRHNVFVEASAKSEVRCVGGFDWPNPKNDVLNGEVIKTSKILQSS